MSNQKCEPTLHGLLNQFEDIGGPELYGPTGIAILLALWRKSSKLGWKESFSMTNTELQVQTGIKSRETINTIRNRLESDRLILSYKAPPKGQSRGDYILNFHFGQPGELVQNLDNPLDNFSERVREPVQNLDNSLDNFAKPVQNLDNLLDTVLKDTITTTSSTDPYIELLEAYCKLNKRLDIHIKPKEREAMGRMVAGGMPNPFTIRTMELLLEEKREREGGAFKYPTSFLYYENGIWESWNNVQTANIETTTVPLKQGRNNPKRQNAIDLLDQIAKEG